MIHAHVTTWFLAILLFFASYYLLKKGNAKGQKITHMSLRLFYLLILATGGHLLSLYQFAGAALAKSIIGLIVIVMMEMTLVKANKGKSSTVFFAQFGLAFVLALYFGYVVLG